jgi:hypothetical protein
MSSVKKHTGSLTPRSFNMPLQSRQEVSERCLQSFMEVSRYMSRYTCDARSRRAGLTILYMPSLRRTVRPTRRPERLGWTRMHVGVQPLLFTFRSLSLVCVGVLKRREFGQREWLWRNEMIPFPVFHFRLFCFTDRRPSSMRIDLPDDVLVQAKGWDNTSLESS